MTTAVATTTIFDRAIVVATVFDRAIVVVTVFSPGSRQAKSGDFQVKTEVFGQGKPQLIRPGRQAPRGRNQPGSHFGRSYGILPGRQQKKRNAGTGTQPALVHSPSCAQQLAVVLTARVVPLPASIPAPIPARIGLSAATLATVANWPHAAYHRWRVLVTSCCQTRVSSSAGGVHNC